MSDQPSSRLLDLKETVERLDLELYERLDRATKVAYLSTDVLGTKAFPVMQKLSAQDFPSLTLRRLEMAARVQLAGGVALLRNQWTAYVADVHVRGLLELLAHVGWITGRAEPLGASSPRCRALCLERGIADAIQEIERSVGALAPDQLPVEAARHAIGQRKHLDGLRNAESCKCKPRRPEHVVASLKAMTGAQRLPRWFGGLYDWLSREIHQQTLDRMLFEVAGKTVFIQSRYSQRAWSLTFLVTTYGQLASWVSSAEGDPEGAARLLGEAQSLVDDQWMDDGRNGKHDEKLGLPAISR